MGLDRPPADPPPGPSPSGGEPGPARLVSLRAWTRGERMIVVAGVLLAGALWRLPWHRFGLSVADDFRRLGLPEVPLFRPLEATALDDPNGFLGRGALALSLLMVAAVVAAKVLSGRRPVPAAWHQLHLVAGASALGLLAAKVAARGEFLAGGAWAALGLAALLAYAGFVRSQEVAGPDAPRPATATEGD